MVIVSEASSLITCRAEESQAYLVSFEARELLISVNDVRSELDMEIHQQQRAGQEHEYRDHDHCYEDSQQPQPPQIKVFVTGSLHDDLSVESLLESVIPFQEKIFYMSEKSTY